MFERRMSLRSKALGIAVAASCVLASCGSDEPAASSDGVSTDAFVERMDAIQQATTEWSEATSPEAATTAAETAANLVVGPNGPGYGDRNGDGIVSGETDVGVLSGLDGTPEGIAVPLADIGCVTRDVLGSTATDVAGGWAEMDAAIAAWTPTGNTMPSLASHPMRIVGWATFTIDSGSLDDAHEYAGHAQLHVDVARDALDC